VVPTAPPSVPASGPISRGEACQRVCGRLVSQSEDQGSEPLCQRARIKRGEKVESDRDADHARRQQARHLAPGDVGAVAAKKRDAGGEPDQRPCRDQNLQGDDEAEQRHGRGGAEAGRAAQRVGGDHHHAAIGNFEWGKRLDGRLRSQRGRAWRMAMAVGLQLIPRPA
jgi:hypothetical protein